MQLTRFTQGAGGIVKKDGDKVMEREDRRNAGRTVVRVDALNCDNTLKLSRKALRDLLPQHHAYIEWFSAIPRLPDPNHLLYKIKCSTNNGVQSASIIPVANIR